MLAVLACAGVGSIRVACGSDAACATVSDAESLRAAVVNTNYTTIVATSGQYDLSTSPCLVTTSSAPAVVGTKNALCVPSGQKLTILAETAGTVVLNATAAQQRILYVAKGAELTVVGVRFAGGSANWGGSILNEGVLHLTNFEISGGKSVWSGGGLCNIGNASLLYGSVTGNDNACSSSLPCVGGGGVANGYEDGYHVVENNLLEMSGVAFANNSAALGNRDVANYHGTVSQHAVTGTGAQK
jgi:hypothetical protein